MNLVDRYKDTLHQTLLRNPPKTLQGLVAMADKYGYQLAIASVSEKHDARVISVNETFGYKV